MPSVRSESRQSLRSDVFFGQNLYNSQLCSNRTGKTRLRIASKDPPLPTHRQGWVKRGTRMLSKTKNKILLAAGFLGKRIKENVILNGIAALWTSVFDHIVGRTQFMSPNQMNVISFLILFLHFCNSMHISVAFEFQSYQFSLLDSSNRKSRRIETLPQLPGFRIIKSPLCTPPMFQ